MPTRSAKKVSPNTNARTSEAPTRGDNRHGLKLVAPARPRAAAIVPALPPPESRPNVPAAHPALLLGLAILAVEILNGSRNVTQLSGMVTEEVMEQLRARCVTRAEHRAMIQDRRRVVPQPVGLRATQPFPDVIEAAAVLRDDTRAFAVAIRLEFSTRRNRWRASCLTVL